MQPPVKKKARRGMPVPLIFVLLAVLLFAGLLLYRYAGQVKRQAIDEALLPDTPDLTLWNDPDVVSFTVSPRGGESYTLLVGEDGLLTTEDSSVTVDKTIADGMLSALRFMEAAEVVAEDANSLADQWQAMGLTEPAVTVTALRGTGESFSFTVGAAAEDGYYFLTDTDSRLLLIPRDAYSTFCVKREELARVDQPVMIPARIRSVALSRADGTPLWEMGVCGGSYTLLSPIVAPLDTDEGEGILTLVSSLLLGSPRGPDTTENRAAAGMDDTAVTVTVRQEPGTESGREATESVLTFTVMIPSGEELQTCVAYKGQLYRSLTYILTPVLTGSWRGWLSRAPLSVTGDALARLTYTANGKTAVFTPDSAELADILPALSAIQVTGSLRGDEAYDSIPAWTLSAELADGTVRDFAAYRMDALNWALTADGVPLFYLSSRTAMPF